MSIGSNDSVSPLRLRRPDRSQVQLVLQCPDELIGPKHKARVIWAVVQALDLSAFEAPLLAREGVAGRDATDPRLLIALWLYAATEGVGSGRQLAALCLDSRPYQWLCGGVSLCHKTLSDFRVGHGQALDELFTQVIAALVHRKVVQVHRVSQDGLRVRAAVGAGSYRREEKLQQLLEEARQHVRQLKEQLEDPAQAAELSARQKAARQRAAKERQQRLEAAVALLPELQKKRSEQKHKEAREKPVRVSTTEASTAVMKMPDGGFRPAHNVQVASDTESRAILAVTVINQGSDTAQVQPMQQEVQRRTGEALTEHLADGGYLRLQDVEQADREGKVLYVPPKPPRKGEVPGSEFAPRPEDSPALQEWRQRMGSEEGQAVYRQRASTSETINADLRCFRGLGKLTVRGAGKVLCVALWSGLAYNLLHFAQVLLQG